MGEVTITIIGTTTIIGINAFLQGRPAPVAYATIRAGALAAQIAAAPSQVLRPSAAVPEGLPAMLAIPKLVAQADALLRRGAYKHIF